jgi:hypothetical protein
MALLMLLLVSKSLEHSDQSGFEFTKELLSNDPTYAINFDRIQWDNTINKYVIVEHLLCDERQFERGITPFTSHPNKYFRFNKHKFISLWAMAQKIGAVLYCVNYSKKGTSYENEVLLLEVTNVDENSVLPVITINTKFTRDEFATWFRKLNKRGIK